MAEVGLILVVCGAIFFLFGVPLPKRIMRLDRPVSGADRFELRRQLQAIRMQPCLRKLGLISLTIGLLLLGLGQILK